LVVAAAVGLARCAQEERGGGSAAMEAVGEVELAGDEEHPDA
jgi:hypothetical protein